MTLKTIDEEYFNKVIAQARWALDFIDSQAHNALVANEEMVLFLNNCEMNDQEDMQRKIILLRTYVASCAIDLQMLSSLHKEVESTVNLLEKGISGET